MLYSGSVTSDKRSQRGFGGIVESIGTHGAIQTPTLVVNRHIRAVVVS